MLHSPVNRLGLGLVTLTGINALIFFLLHIITHALGRRDREKPRDTGKIQLQRAIPHSPPRICHEWMEGMAQCPKLGPSWPSGRGIQG